MKSGILSSIKMQLVNNVPKPREVLSGPFKGLKFSINLASQSQLYLGLWERETYPAIEQAGGQATWFVDVGAGSGELCCYFAKRENVRQIFAIDPLERDMALAKSNAALNRISDGRITYLKKFIAVDTADNAMRLDDLSLGDGPGFIKIDVDGFEMDVLRSGPTLLARNNVSLLIETHSADLERKCISFLQAMNYRCGIINNASWRWLVPEQRPIEHNRWLSAAK
jgi:SAM-dependent methyltransferase